MDLSLPHSHGEWRIPPFPPSLSPISLSLSCSRDYSRGKETLSLLGRRFLAWSSLFSLPLSLSLSAARLFVGLPATPPACQPSTLMQLNFAFGREALVC
jgi:hypothetical protein